MPDLDEPLGLGDEGDDPEDILRRLLDPGRDDIEDAGEEPD